MNDILHILQNFIISIGTLGGLSCYAAIRGVRLQLKTFNKNPNPLGIDITSDTPPDEHAERIKQLLKNEGVTPPPTKQKNKPAEKQPKTSNAPSIFARLRAWWYAPQNLLHHRVEPMLTVAESKEGNRRLPSIDDMHEWSLDREFGRPCVSLHQLVVGSLLIMGILGTLIGIHSSLMGTEGSNNSIFTRLLPALEPSMWAVGFTIILTIGKGIYSAMLEGLLSKLDRYTLDTLVPALQPANSFEDIDTRMSNALLEINNLVQHFHAISQNTCAAGLQVQQYVQGMQHALGCLSHIAEQIETTEQRAASADAQLTDISSNLQTLGDLMATHFHTMSNDMESLFQHGDTVGKKLKSTENSYREITLKMEEKIKQLADALPSLLDKQDYFDELKEVVDSLSLQMQEMADLRLRASHMELGVNSILGQVNITVERSTQIAQHLQTILTEENRTTDTLAKTNTAAHSYNQKRWELYSQSAELLQYASVSMRKQEGLLQGFVKRVQKHSKKYNKSLFTLFHPLEWAALILAFLTLCKILN